MCLLFFSFLSSLLQSHKAHLLSATAQNELRFREQMRLAKGMEIIDQKEDGNCLFRSVSHQVYGDPKYHYIVRDGCMKYIVSNVFGHEDS